MPDFPIYGDRETSFQADCIFMPPTKQYVGCLCFILVNHKIAWAEPFLEGFPTKEDQEPKESVHEP